MVQDVPAALAADSAPSDSLPRQVGRDTARRDTMPPADTTTVRVPVPEVLEVPADDTSLTARMDVSRGGGLRREQFPDLVESARLTGRYAVFLAIAARGGFGPALAGPEPLTLIAPTDSAFAALDSADVEGLRADSAAAAAFAGALIVAGDYPAAALAAMDSLTSIGGTPLVFDRGPGGTLQAGAAAVIQPDLLARNGRLHGVDRVRLPPAAPPTSAAP